MKAKHGFGGGGGGGVVVEVDVDVVPGGIVDVVLVLVVLVLVVVDEVDVDGEVEVVELDDVVGTVDVVELGDVDVVDDEVDVVLEVLVVEVDVVLEVAVVLVVAGEVLVVDDVLVVGADVLVLEDVLVVGADVLVVGAVVEVDAVELVVLDALTSGPVALQRDSARVMSNTGRPGSATGGSSIRWTPRTMMLVFPGVLLTICSLRMAVRTPGTVTTVFAAGVWTSGLPPSVALTRLIEPVDPSPLDVHVLEMAVAVSALAPTTTSATLAELVEKPAWLSPATFPPCVDALSTPVLSTVGMEMGTELPVIGPYPFVGSAANPATFPGAGGMIVPSKLDVTVAPKALPSTLSTSAPAGEAR